MIYFSVKEFQKELKALGFNVPKKIIYDHIKAGTITAHREILRPSRIAIPESELHRVVNFN